MTPTWAAAVLGLALTGCLEEEPGTTDETSSGSATEDESDDASESESAESSGSATDATATDTDPPPTSTGAESTGMEAESSSGGGPPLEGPGCGVEPACDKGELVGSVEITSSDQIEEIAGYTSLTGWLNILNTDLVCLDFLACLEGVGHDLSIFGNDELRSVQGLNNLQAVGTSTAGMADEDGTISISQNAVLEDITGFGALEQVQESLQISEHPALTRVTGFANLVVIHVDITIQFNAVLENLSGVSNLLALGNECIITNNESLCVSETVNVCGDLDQWKGFDEDPPTDGPPGNTANNDNSC